MLQKSTIRKVLVLSGEIWGMNSFILRISWVSLIGFCLLVSLHLVINCEAATSKNKPYRIISLSPSLSEILFSIGAGEQVIAVDNYSNYPTNAPKTNLSAYEPNLEAIASLEPDLVIFSYDIGHLSKGLNLAGIRTLLLPAPNDFDEILQQIKILGQITINTKKAEKLIFFMEDEMGKLILKRKKQQPQKIYHEIDENYYSASTFSFIGSIYAKLNFINIADPADKGEHGYPKLSPEHIIASNPDLIITTGENKERILKIKKRPGWKHINAIKNNMLLEIDPDIASRWGPRIINFASDIVNFVELD